MYPYPTRLALKGVDRYPLPTKLVHHLLVCSSMFVVLWLKIGHWFLASLRIPVSTVPAVHQSVMAWEQPIAQQTSAPSQLPSTPPASSMRHMINQTVSVSMERLQVLTTGLPREKARLPGPLVAGTARKLHAIATSTGTLLSLIVHHCTMVTSTYERDCRSSATRLPVAIPTRHVCACMYLT